MTTPLEQAAENVLLAILPDLPFSILPEPTQALLCSAIQSYGDQRFIEGATAMREMAAKVAHDFKDGGQTDDWFDLVDLSMSILALDPNQLKDTDHG